MDDKMPQARSENSVSTSEFSPTFSINWFIEEEFGILSCSKFLKLKLSLFIHQLVHSIVISIFLLKLKSQLKMICFSWLMCPKIRHYLRSGIFTFYQPIMILFQVLEYHSLKFPFHLILSLERYNSIQILKLNCLDRLNNQIYPKAKLNYIHIPFFTQFLLERRLVNFI